MNENLKKNDPNRIIIHCSDTEDSGDKIGLKEIRQWHITERGFLDIGYHYVIRRTGLIEIGRPEDEIGAHCQGQNNDSLGICLVGTRHFTYAQYEALVTLVRAIRDRHKISIENVFGHYEFNNRKECPCLDMNLVRSFLSVENFKRSILKV
jgi:hypothetical protein